MQIRGQEGRAGMAAILDPDRTTDFKVLAQGIRKALPSYARPLFIRILSKVDLTGILDVLSKTAYFNIFFKF